MNAQSRRRRQGVLVWALACATLSIAGCETDGVTPPGSTRFGQTGEIRVTVVTPLPAPGEVTSQGELQQVLSWSATGAWQLFESVSYREDVGDENLRRNPGDPLAFASSYASLITQLNESPALELFIPALDETLDPECGSLTSRVTVYIRDGVADEEKRWTRCGEGSLGELVTAGAGPDAEADRVVQAAILARDFALGDAFTSSYLGTLPFGTIDRGEDTPADLTGPLVFQTGTVPSASASAEAEFNRFWQQHAPGVTLPSVNWEEQMVLVGAIGAVDEAGDSIEVRRVVGDGFSITVEFYERRPGDFCAPAARTHVPYHIIVVPRVEQLVRFAEPRQERVSCGF